MMYADSKAKIILTGALPSQSHIMNLVELLFFPAPNYCSARRMAFPATYLYES